jgi:hypothetical protein
MTLLRRIKNLSPRAMDITITDNCVEVRWEHLYTQPLTVFFDPQFTDWFQRLYYRTEHTDPIEEWRKRVRDLIASEYNKLLVREFIKGDNYRTVVQFVYNEDIFFDGGDTYLDR